MKKILFILLLCAFSTTAQSKKLTTVYLVRHAEKLTDDPTNKDPMLTEKGEKRAVALAEALKKIALENIYSTKYIRTRATVTPIAHNRKMEIKIYDATHLKAEAKTILEENRGKNVLIVGHSNTVLETIEALGAQRPVNNISDQEYDYLFKLTITSTGTTKVKVLHYGKPNSKTEVEQKMGHK